MKLLRTFSGRIGVLVVAFALDNIGLDKFADVALRGLVGNAQAKGNRQISLAVELVG